MDDNKLNKDKIELQLLLKTHQNITSYASYLKKLIQERITETEEKKELSDEQKHYIATEVLIERLSLISLSFVSTICNEVFTYQNRFPKIIERRDASLHIAFAAFNKVLTDKNIFLNIVQKDSK